MSLDAYNEYQIIADGHVYKTTNSYANAIRILEDYAKTDKCKGKKVVLTKNGEVIDRLV